MLQTPDPTDRAPAGAWVSLAQVVIPRYAFVEESHGRATGELLAIREHRNQN